MGYCAWEPDRVAGFEEIDLIGHPHLQPAAKNHSPLLPFMGHRLVPERSPNFIPPVDRLDHRRLFRRGEFESNAARLDRTAQLTTGGIGLAKNLAVLGSGHAAAVTRRLGKEVSQRGPERVREPLE